MAGASSAADKVTIEQESTKRKRDLELKIRKRVACEERAFRIVEKLIEGTFTEDYLIDCGHFITPSHYCDIAEERAIVNLCGYPICSNALGKVPQQKFYISTKSNKVYDITERKNFCSNKCCKASKYFEKQISTTPVWLRDSEEPRKLTVLESSINIGSSGSEIIGGKQKPISDFVLDNEYDDCDTSETTTSLASNSTSASVIKTDKKSVSWASDNTCTNDGLTGSFTDKLKIDDNSTKNEPISDEAKIVKDAGVNSGLPSNEAKSVDKLLEEESTKKLESEASSTKSKTDYLMQLLNKRKNLLSKMVDDQPLQPEEEEKNINQKMISHLKEDAQHLKIIERTITSQKQNVDIIGTSSIPVQSIVNTSGQKVDESNVTNSVTVCTGTCTMNSVTEANFSSPQDGGKQCPEISTNLPSNVLTVYNRVSDWVTIATMYYLDVLEKIDKKGDNNADRNDSKLQSDIEEDSAPETVEIQRGKEVDFHTIHQQNKDFTIKVREFYKGSFTYKPPESATTEDGKEDTRGEPVLPPVDSIAQLTIRRKIVLQKLERSMSDVLRPIGLAIQHVGTEIRDLVSTFNLTSKNIVMKPDEWKLASLFLVKMLMKKLPVLQESFSQGTSLSVFENLLRKYSISLKDLEEALQNIYKFKKTITQDKLD